MKRCVVISAGQISDYERAKSFIRKGDFFIFCDAGLCHAEGLRIVPDVIVGDFDSCDKDLLAKYEAGAGESSAVSVAPVETSSIEIIRLPREKDDTDSFFAVKLALERGYDDFLFLGSMGARFDHTLGNISILVYLHEHHKNAVLADDYSFMKIVGSEPFCIEDSCSYFSVLTVAGDVSGVSIKNAKYPLENANLSCNFQLGISNEVLPNQTASVCVQNGCVLVVVVK